MDINTFNSILLSAGINPQGRGARRSIASLLDITLYTVDRAIRFNEIKPAAAQAAARLKTAVENGTFTPVLAEADAAGLPTPAQLHIPNPEDDLTDEEVLAGANERAAACLQLSTLTARGKLPLCVITGPGGIGKTFPTMRMLEELRDNNTIAGFRSASGTMTPVILMEYLWDCRFKGMVLVLDDCDLDGAEALNLLKAATDSKACRTVTYGKASKRLAEAGIDNEFVFEGSVIVISNVNMAGKATKSGHMDAILSRGVHMDMGINTKRALALRVSYMIREMEMLSQEFAKAGEMDLYEQGKEEIALFIETNKDIFRSLTLREANKIAKVYLGMEGDPAWMKLMTLSLSSVAPA